MGDRGNVAVRDFGKDVFFYTHWAGTELPKTVGDALARSEDRWDDGPYLARIIFEEMIKDDIGSNTGYGISTVEMDPEHPLIVVDVERQTVFRDGEEYSFTDYAEGAHA